MKRMLYVMVLGVLLWGPGAASAQKSLRVKLARVDAEIEQKTLDLNHQTVACYLEYVERNRITPPLKNYPGLDYPTLCDSVPEIKALGDRYKEADEAYVNILKSDSLYEEIHREYTALKGVDDKTRKDANTEQYNLMYSRLRKANPDYAAALDRRSDAMRERNIALVRLLFDRAVSEGRPVLTDPLFKGYSDTMKALRAMCPRIGAMEGELNTLNRLRREVYEQLVRDELGIPVKTKPEKVEVRGL